MPPKWPMWGKRVNLRVSVLEHRPNNVGMDMFAAVFLHTILYDVLTAACCGEVV